MDLVLVVLLVLAVGGVVALALGRLSGGLVPASEDVAPPLEHDVAAAGDLDRARFALAFRGYRMDQVDDVLDQARDLIAAKDEEIGRLRRELDGGVDPTADPTAVPTAEPTAGAAVKPTAEPTAEPVTDPSPPAGPGDLAPQPAEPAQRRP